MCLVIRVMGMAVKRVVESWQSVNVILLASDILLSILVLLSGVFRSMAQSKAGSIFAKLLPALLSVGVRGFELSASVLYVFVVAFCVLALRARCLSLRSLFSLNVLALLHRCYMERFWDMGVSVALLL